jgi:nucleotide-binding universal stress UspA family protein
MYSNILLAIDPDEPKSWARALPVAASLARCFSARLTLGAVVRDLDAEREAEWSPIGYREMIDHARVRLRMVGEEAGDLAVSVEVASGTICGGILDIADRVGADLIVLASHRPELKDYILGANASRVARRANCSVLVVRESEVAAVPGAAAEATTAAGDGQA